MEIIYEAVRICKYGRQREHFFALQIPLCKVFLIHVKGLFYVCFSKSILGLHMFAIFEWGQF